MKQILTVLAAGLLFLPFPLIYHTGLMPVAEAPLYGWLQWLAESIFGTGPFAARLPNALTGVLTILTCFVIGKRREDERFGMWWALILAGSMLPQLLFRSNAPMLPGYYFLFLSIYLTYRVSWSTSPFRAAIYSGIAFGLATLATGPSALIIALLTGFVYWTWKRFHTGMKWPHLLTIVMAAVVSSGWYYAYLIWRGTAIHIQPFPTGGVSFSTHWVAFLGCFPAVAFLFTWLQTARTRSIYLAQTAENKDFVWWMWALFWTGLLVFSVMRVPLAAASLLHLPLSYLAVVQVNRILEGRLRLRRWNVAILLVMGLGTGLLLTLLPIAGIYRPSALPPCFRADAHWHLAEAAFGIVLLILTATGTTLLAKKRAQEGLLILFAGSMILIPFAAICFGPKMQQPPQEAVAVAVKVP